MQILIEGYGSGLPVGGYFIWVAMPMWCQSSDPSSSPEALLAAAKNPPYRVCFTLGEVCKPSHGGNTEKSREHIRMCFARYLSYFV